MKSQVTKDPNLFIPRLILHPNSLEMVPGFCPGIIFQNTIFLKIIPFDQQIVWLPYLS